MCNIPRHRLMLFCSICVLCVSGVGGSFAGYKQAHDDPNADYRVANWDTIRENTDTQGNVYLRQRLKELSRQNIELKTAIQALKSQSDFNDASPKHDARIQALVEENKRLTLLLNSRDNKLDSLNNTEHYATEIQRLKMENASLESRLVQHVNESAQRVQALSAQVSEKNEVIKSLNTHLSVLKIEAQEKGEPQAGGVDNALASTTHKRSSDAYDTDQLRQLLISMQNEIKILKQEKHALQQGRIKNSDMKELREQNEQLRQTIKAQNDVLRSSENASSHAEIALAENVNLKHQLDMMQKAQKENAKSAQDLFMMNEKLRQEIAKRDVYLQKLEQQISNHKGGHTVSQGTFLDKNEAVLLRARIEDMENNARKERDIATSYRKKIKYYQDELVRQEALLEKKSIEVQDLKARLDLVSNSEASHSGRVDGAL